MLNDDSLREWVEWTLETEGIHPMLEALCRRYLELEEKDMKRNWPVTLHEQYLAVLDERDALQERIDELENQQLRQNKKVKVIPCEHEWDRTSINMGPPGGDWPIDICIKCGAQVDV